jgi:hypothetical protein
LKSEKSKGTTSPAGKEAILAEELHQLLSLKKVRAALKQSLCENEVKIAEGVAKKLGQQDPRAGELSHDGLAVMLGLFGLVYRYAVRQDSNPQLKQGVVGAFVITRTLSMLQASEECSALPLSCGPPLGYFNWEMIATGVGAGVESALAFAAAAAAIELAFSKEFIRRFPTL